MCRESECVRRVMTLILRAALVGAAGACYSYVPLAAPSARAGDEVRVHLTPSGTSDLARDIGPRMAAVDGRVLRVSADSGVTLAVTQLRSMRGDRASWEGDAPLLIPPSAVASVERRQLARGRTAVLSTGMTAGLAAIGVYAVRRGGKGGGGGGPPPPPPP